MLARSKEQATRLKNQTALTELSRVHIPFRNKEELYYQRKWLFKLNGIPVPDSALTQFFAELPSSLYLVGQEAFAKNYAVTIPKINCPIYFFSGKKDYQTNLNLAYNYYKQLQAKNKHFYWFDKSAHIIPCTEPDLFQQIVLDNVLRETLK